MHAFSRAIFHSRIISPISPPSSLLLRQPLASILHNHHALFPRPLPYFLPRQSRSIHISTPPPPPPRRFPRRNQYQRFQSRASSFRDLWQHSPQFRLLILVISAGLLTGFVYNIEEVPISRRKRFNIISPALEARLGKSAYQSIMEEVGSRILPENHPTTRMVKEVMQRLVKVSGKYSPYRSYVRFFFLSSFLPFLAFLSLFSSFNFFLLTSLWWELTS